MGGEVNRALASGAALGCSPPSGAALGCHHPPLNRDILVHEGEGGCGEELLL